MAMAGLRGVGRRDGVGSVTRRWIRVTGVGCWCGAWRCGVDCRRGIQLLLRRLLRRRLRAKWARDVVNHDDLRGGGWGGALGLRGVEVAAAFFEDVDEELLHSSCVFGGFAVAEFVDDDGEGARHFVFVEAGAAHGVADADARRRRGRYRLSGDRRGGRRDDLAVRGDGEDFARLRLLRFLMQLAPFCLCRGVTWWSMAEPRLPGVRARLAHACRAPAAGRPLLSGLLRRAFRWRAPMGDFWQWASGFAALAEDDAAMVVAVAEG